MDAHSLARVDRQDAPVQRSHQPFRDRPARLPVQVQRQGPAVVQVQQQPNPVACVQLPVDGIVNEVAFVGLAFQEPARVIVLVHHPRVVPEVKVLAGSIVQVDLRSTHAKAPLIKSIATTLANSS